MDELDNYHAAEIFAEQSGLTEYEMQIGVSRDVAKRHAAIRRLIAEASGIVPSPGELRVSLMVKGIVVSVQTVRNLKAMGWR